MRCNIVIDEVNWILLVHKQNTFHSKKHILIPGVTIHLTKVAYLDAYQLKKYVDQIYNFMLLKPCEVTINTENMRTITKIEIWS